MFGEAAGGSRDTIVSSGIEIGFDCADEKSELFNGESGIEIGKRGQENSTTGVVEHV
jgi:hypothetical protein